MIGQNKLFEILAGVVRKAKGEATAICQAEVFGLSRFANNHIHQNVYNETHRVTIRAKLGKRVGIASTTSLDAKSLESALRNAETIAEATPEIPDLAPLAGMRAYRHVPTFDQTTAFFTAEQRARAVKGICDLAKSDNAVASGLFSTGYVEVCIVNSIGMRAYAPLTKAELKVIIQDDPASGYSTAVSRKVSDINFEANAKTALEKCRADRNRVDIEPGDYEVVLEHSAVADALEWLTYIAFTSKSVEEGTSFLAGRKGEKITGENISIYDDGYNEKALGMPFDFEGMPKMPVYFINKGVAGTGVHDTQSAARAKAFSTGHASPPEERNFGAFPTNVIMEPGDAETDDMISSMKKGILVTRFHYINGFIDTRQGVLTGMTRDGTFLVEEGKIVGGLPNLRFMQSFLEAFSNVQQVSREQKARQSWWGEAGAFLTPALRIKDFRFIGVQRED